MASFDLEAYLRHQSARLEEALAARLAYKNAPPRLLEAMRYSLLDGGKRLRPVLCLTYADAVAGTSNGGGALALDAACALEMIHTYSLIHDDLPSMDDAASRRGRPSSHRAFGEALAILAGDALLTEAFALLAQGPSAEAGRRLALVGELGGAAGAQGMVGGQVLDIAEDRPADEGELLRLHRLKTGALIRASCRMGALAAGASPEELARATVYGEAVGLAFQIADDVLDVTSTNEVLGKPSGADRAKHTFPSVLGLEKSRALAAAQVEKALAAIVPLEPVEGPLAALARFAVQRSR
ncbi:MAG: polyprenyl synthetase family protein [Myxococcota bacterium]